MTATYTTPKTWTSALVTSADMNTHIRDMMDYLKARTIERVSDYDGTVANTTSTSFTDLTGASLSITTVGSSRLLILAHVWFSNANINNFTVLVDGVNQGDATEGLLRTNYSGTMITGSFQHLTTAAVSDGAHTVKIQYKTNTGTLTVNGFGLTVLEVM